MAKAARSLFAVGADVPAVIPKSDKGVFVPSVRTRSSPFVASTLKKPSSVTVAVTSVIAFKAARTSSVEFTSPVPVPNVMVVAAAVPT